MHCVYQKQHDIYIYNYYFVITLSEYPVLCLVVCIFFSFLLVFFVYKVFFFKKKKKKVETAVQLQNRTIKHFDAYSATHK